MATQFASAWSQPAPIPFLLAPAKGALEAAADVERVSAAGRNTRCRTSFLLCELGRQLAVRLPSFHLSDALPVSRGEIAEVLGISLAKVKRVLALLTLSGVVRPDPQGLRVTDWRRLCSVAHYDAEALRLVQSEDEDDILILSGGDEEDDSSHRLTAAGEPACFV